MASLSNKIREYAKANGINEVDFSNDVMLQDDSNGKGAYIKEWNLDIAKPTQEQLDALEIKIVKMANEPEQSAYAQARKNSYPEIGDQLDMLWHSIDQNPALKSQYFDFYEAIKAVKVKNPKNG
jgi:hypothetical protein